MIVIVIVGILSAVALPNFMKQTDKAKATEAKTSLTAIIKQAQASFVEDGNDPSTTTGLSTAAGTIQNLYGAPEDGVQKFNYSAAYNDTTKLYTVMAKGNSTDSNTENKKIFGCIDLETGLIDASKNLLGDGTTADTTTSDVNCDNSAPADAQAADATLK